MSGSSRWGKQWGALTLALALLLSPPPYVEAQGTPSTTLSIEAVGSDVALLGSDSSFLSSRDSSASLATCDLNGDGIQDLLAGAEGLRPPGAPSFPNPAPGGAFVVYGADNGSPGWLRDLATDRDVVIFGIDLADFAGLAVGCSDINGDAWPDIVIGAYAADGPNNDRPSAGEVYVIYGGPNLPSVIDLAATPADLTIFGNSVVNNLGQTIGDHLGFSLALGDLNGDSIDDLIMGAFNNGGPNSSRTARSGAVFVVYGRSDLPATIDFASQSPDLVLYGEEQDDVAGISVAAGDIDGDGFDDLVVGAVGGDGPNNTRPVQAGELYVVYGSQTLPPVVDVAGDLGPQPDSRVYGAMIVVPGLTGPVNAWDNLGWSLALGDLNGDGAEDIIAGAIAGGASVGRPAAGAVYVTYGRRLPAVIDVQEQVAPGADVVLWGAQGSLSFGDDNLGWAVASGDVNGDGIVDLLAVAEDGDGPFRRLSVGAVYAYYGGNLPAVMDIRGELGPPPDVILYPGGGPANTSPGFLKVAAGDVNGDGVDELIAGSPLTFIPPPLGGDEGRIAAGSVHIFSIPRLAALPAPPAATVAHYNANRKRLKITVPGATGNEIVEINGHLVGPWWDIRRPISFDPATSRFIVKGGRGHLFLSKTPGVNTIVIIKDGLRSSPLFF